MTKFLVQKYIHQKEKFHNTVNFICCISWWTFSPPIRSQRRIQSGQHSCESPAVCWWHMCIWFQY